MTREQALAVLGATCCVDGTSRAQHPPRHLVLTGNRRVCDGRVLTDAVIADSEVPTCVRCRNAATNARRVEYVTREDAQHDRHAQPTMNPQQRGRSCPEPSRAPPTPVASSSTSPNPATPS